MDYRDRWEIKAYQVEQRLDGRVRLFHAGVILLMLGLLLGFWYLQVVRGDHYAGEAELNRLRKVPLYPVRGEIYDRHGRVVASTRPSLRLFMLREGLSEREQQLRRLEAVLQVPYDRLESRLERVRRRPLFEPAILKEDLRLDEVAPIEARPEAFPSIEIRQTARRTYPDGESVAHVLGYVGEVSEEQLRDQPGNEFARGDVVGKAGLEKTYDETLRGVRGFKYVTVNNVGRALRDAGLDQRPVGGQSMTLTLDLELQRTLVDALGDEVGAGVFLDPWTGEVLALASTPTFDANLFAGGLSSEAWQGMIEDRRRPLHNRAIASHFAPGSTFKIVTATAGLETGAVDPDRRVWCNGSTRVYDRRFLCWKRGGHGWVTLHDALVHSCNVFFYQLGRDLGIDPIHDYGARYGLGRPTGVDIPGEGSGLLPSEAWKRRELGKPWYPGETISVAIGQGRLTTTPIQLATMMAVVATAGQRPTPHLVRDRLPPPERVDIRPETFERLKAALREVVERGTARRARLPDVAVAGKTGTAQVYKHSAGIDADLMPKEERDHAWFAGFAPADRPQIAFAVVVEHGGHGGTTAAPVARAVLDRFFDDRPARPSQVAFGGPRRKSPDARQTSAR